MPFVGAAVSLPLFPWRRDLVQYATENGQLRTYSRVNIRDPVQCLSAEKLYTVSMMINGLLDSIVQNLSIYKTTSWRRGNCIIRLSISHSCQ